MKKRMFQILSLIIVAVLTFNFIPVIATVWGTDKLQEENWDYAFEIAKNQADITELNEAFSAYSFSNISSSAPTVSSANVSDWYSATGTVSIGRGYLRPKSLTAGNNNYKVMTYTKQQFTNFYAEYDMYFGYAIIGMMFGADKGKFVLSRDGNALNDTGVEIYCERDNAGTLNLGGAIDTTTLTLPSGSTTGTQSNLSNTNHTRVRYMSGLSGALDVPESGAVVPDSVTCYTVCVKVAGGVCSVWLKGHEDRVTSVALADTYGGGYVSLIHASATVNPQGAFRGFRIRDLGIADAQAEVGFEVEQDLTSESDQAILSKKYDAYSVLPGNNEAASAKPVSDLWETSSDGLTALKTGEQKNLLTYRGKIFSHVESSVDLAAGKSGGIMLAPRGFSVTSENGGIQVSVQDGKLLMEGAINPDTAKISKGSVKKEKTAVSSDTIPGYDASVGYTLNLTVNNGALTASLEELDCELKVALSDSYIGGVFSIFTDQKATFTGFRICEIESILPAEDGTAIETDFTMGTVSDLKDTYSAYYFSPSNTASQKGDVTALWTYNGTQNGYFKNNYLKPLNSSGYTLLSVKGLTFDCFEAEYEYLTCHSEFGIMVAPFAKNATEQNGIRVRVEGGGNIRIDGAIDSGTAETSGFYAAVGKNYVRTGKVSGSYVSAVGDWDHAQSNKTSYHLHIKICDGILTAYLTEFPQAIVSVRVTENYTGGALSLFANANSHGAFKSFRVTALSKSEGQTFEKIFEQSFARLSSAEDLNANFTAYTLADISQTMRPSLISDLFKTDTGKLTSKRATESASYDYNDFSILTLGTKRYRNFELKLNYEQTGKRYAVMFGTELGQFAFKGNSGNVRSNGGVLVYTEMEGYRNIRGALKASSMNSPSQALARFKEDPLLPSFVSAGSASDTIKAGALHTMVIRVVGDYMTMIVDGDESSRATVALDAYKDGYISLVTNAKAGTGAFNYLSIVELDENAELKAEKPEAGNGFDSLSEVGEKFDSYYLENAAVSHKMEKVGFEDEWWINESGMVARDKATSGSETKDVNVLTYKARKFTDFELEYDFSQTFARTGIIFGANAGEFPLSKNGNVISATGGVLFFIEAEGYCNAMGDFASGYTSVAEVRRRETKDRVDGFVDSEEKALSNVRANKIHHVKVVVKNKEMFVFVDHNSTYSFYLKLSDSYNGGYVSMFSSSQRADGLDCFEISPTVTTALPAGSGVTVKGNTLTATFANQKTNLDSFTSYYMDDTNADGKLQKVDFNKYWMTVNRKLQRIGDRAVMNDYRDIAVLTYNKPMTDFTVTYDYQKTNGRLIFMFGTQKGKYAVGGKSGAQEYGGVILYPENDLGAGGGLCAIGNVTPCTTSYRPTNRVFPNAPGYHDAGNNSSNSSSWHTMTVTVLKGQCYIWLDDYGLISNFALTDDYKGGYISLCSSLSAKNGFRNLTLTDLTQGSGNLITSVKDPRDITVKTGTAVQNIGLPSTVNVSLKSGKTATVGVTWDISALKAGEPGIYTVFGNLKEGSFANSGKLIAKVNVRVKDTVEKSSSAVRFWSFDTNDDLNDFTSYYCEDAKSGSVKTDNPAWFAKNGTLQSDPRRSVNGNESARIRMLCYEKESYKDFELEVDYTQHYTRLMVMFGSKKPGQYLDYSNPKSEDNPIAAFVEYEGRINVIGNVVNTDFYSRTDSYPNKARQSYQYLEDYYDKENKSSCVGNVHHMKLRVVGKQLSIWIDGAKTPFTTAINDGYEGGYISLVSCEKNGNFDNLKITRLNQNGNIAYKDPSVKAKGTLNVMIDESADTALALKKPVIKEIVTSDTKPEENKKKSFPLVPFTVITLAAIITLAGSILVIAAAKRKK